MKKIYTFLILFIAGFAFGQNVVISTIVDGTLGSDGCTSTTTGTSSPKVVELYVSGTVDFTNYRIQVESNGAADASLISWSSGLDISPLGTVTNSFVYLVGSGNITFNEMYPSIVLPAFSASSLNGNGNDAYRIVITDGAATPAVVSVVDQFGNPLDIPSSSDYSAVWAYQDSYAKRIDNIGPNGGNFDNASFTYGGNAAFVAPNNTCAFISAAIDLGSFNLANTDFATNGFKVYPNPVTNGFVYIQSASTDLKRFTVYDILGKEVMKAQTINEPVDVSSLKTGIYLLRIVEANKESLHKLVIR